MSGQHAFLPPSSAAIWVKCAAAPSMMAQYPEPEDGVEAAEGTAAHWVFERMFPGEDVDVGHMAPNGVFVTEEMLDGAEMYVGAVDEVLARHASNRSVLVIERRVAIPYVHPTLNWGTPDTWAFLHDPTTGIATLYVFDYKFGHDYVDAFENWQCIDYACGILDELGIDGHADQHIRVEIILVQPRNYHSDGPVRRWRVTASDLRAYFNTLHNAASAATSPNPAATVNPKCKHCSGRHACAALQRSAYEAADLSLRSLPVDLPTGALATERVMLQRAQAALDARVSGLDESIFAAIKRGERVPGFGAEPTVGRRAWTRPVEEIIQLGAMLQLNLAKPGVITPVQAKKAGLDDALIAAYSDAPRGALKLVADPSNLARKVFPK